MIGTRLKELRSKSGLTISGLCEKLQMNQNTYAKYERDERDVSTETLSKLADFYGVTTDYLLGREPIKNPLQGLNIGVEAVDSEKFIEEYDKLPDIVKQVFIDTMLKLSEAAIQRDGEYLYNGWTAEQLHAELDRQLKAEETAKERSGAS